MTDTIIDEARALLDNLRDDFLACSAGQDVWLVCDAENALIKIQSALTAARNKALEDAANACEERFMKLARGDYLLPDAEPQLNDCVELADAIRAMKVQL